MHFSLPAQHAMLRGSSDRSDSTFQLMRLLAMAAVFLLLNVGAAYAQTENLQKQEPEQTEAAETPVQFPAFPEDAALVPFNPSPTASFVFLVDPTSLTLTPEGTIRFTLVAKSDQGVKNVSYEGIRCATMQRKTYGFGRADRSWSAARSGVWHEIDTLNANQQYSSLALDYFCQDNTVAGSIDQITRKLLRQK